MSFLPIAHPALIAVGALAAIGLVVWRLVADADHRASWFPRLFLVLACVALALRPGLPEGSAQQVVADIDVVLVVDSTTSMVAEDWDDGPRLEGVRADVQQLIEAYPGARFSLITFDNSASQRLPLTTDVDAVMSALEVLTPPTTAYARGSDIGVAAPLLAQVLTAQEAASDEFAQASTVTAAASSRAQFVFYFGDGEQTAETDPTSFAGASSLVAGGQVLGYGTDEGGRMQVDTGRAGDDEATEYLQYEGSDALSMIDEENLSTIAADLGVGYAHRSPDAPLALPDPPRVSASLTDSASVGARTELSWILALVVAGLLVWEIAGAARRVRQTIADVRRPE
jgi:Ca-activated chloride channel family protein